MDLKKLKHFQMMQLDCTIESARVKVTRYNKKNNDFIKVTNINGKPYVYRDFFDIKEVDHNIMYTLIDQLKDSLEKIKIFESDEDIL